MPKSKPKLDTNTRSYFAKLLLKMSLPVSPCFSPNSNISQTLDLIQSPLVQFQTRHKAGEQKEDVSHLAAGWCLAEEFK